jgi:hypothetical protein
MRAGANHRGSSAFPEVGGRIGVTPLLVKVWSRCNLDRMVKREDILWLGVAAGVGGSLVGGMMLGTGMGLVVQGAHIGWLLILPGAPVAGLMGYMLAKRLAGRLPPDPRR